MGNWRTVQIEGTCDAADVPALKEYLAVDFSDPRWGPLHNGGMGGLPNWAAEKIEACGNLGERDYTVENVRDELLKMSGVAPSLFARIHCGGDNESTTCVATVTISRGYAVTHEPKVEEVSTPSADQVRANMMAQLSGRRG